MILGKALKLCPNLTTLPYDFDEYKRVASWFYDVIASLYCEVQAVSCDEVYIDVTQLINDRFDIISCLETLEHFREEDQKEHLLKMRKLLKPDGVIYISVPIEVYLSGFIKIILRVLMGQSQENTSLKNVFRTLFGLKISNPDNFSKNYLTTSEDYLNTHMGFYYFDLINIIKKMGFEIQEVKFSPFPFLKSFLNSQIFIKIK